MLLPLLKVKDLSYERDDRLLFANLNFELYSGEVLHVEGPNGAGKTTLLRILCGLSSLYEGELQWGELTEDSDVFLQNCLYLGHLAGVNNNLTALENLAWYSALFHPASTDDLLRALASVQLQGYEDLLCSQLSAGQKRRVALARLYLSQAKVWILDEPFTSLDQVGISGLEQQIYHHLKNGGGVVITSHQALNLLTDVKKMRLGN